MPCVTFTTPSCASPLSLWKSKVCATQHVLTSPGLPKVLNLVLHKLNNRRVDAAELAFLAVDEQLVDIGDDLFDYEVPYFTAL